MTSSRSRRSRAALRQLAAFTPLVLLSLACIGEVDGERAATGSCPEGETCSDATPSGLVFVGQVFFDQDVVQLGPLLVGGSFDLGLRTADGAPLPSFSHAVSDGRVLTASRGTGVFGPVDEETGEPFYPVDAHLVLRGERVGTTMVRIVEAGTGALLDRMPLEVLELDDVRLVNVGQGTDHVHAGCEAMIGVRLIAGGDREIRAFDLGVEVQSDVGPLRQEARFWDCHIVDVPADRSAITFTVRAAGRTFVRSMQVRTLESDGLTECPAIQLD